MKFITSNERIERNASLPVRGAWVEIPGGDVFAGAELCRSPCGERGLKWLAISEWLAERGRSPCGERGLKYGRRASARCLCDVAPRAGSVG